MGVVLGRRKGGGGLRLLLRVSGRRSTPVDVAIVVLISVMRGRLKMRIIEFGIVGPEALSEVSGVIGE